MSKRARDQLTCMITVTILVASIFALPVVRSVYAAPSEPEAIELLVERVDIVHTTDLAVEGEVITILEFTSPIAISLLDLQDGILTSLGLSTSDLPDGFVTQFRIVAIDAVIIFDGEAFPLVVPSGVFKLNGILIVPDDEDALFEINAEAVRARRQDFLLKPSIGFESV